jgi:hypothetical protein
MPTTPCLAAVYGAKNGVPLRADVEPMQMIEPPPPAMRCGVPAVIVFQTPVRLVSRICCQTSGVTSSQACSAHTAALATTTSSRPSSATPSATAAVSAAASRTSACRATTRRPSAWTSRAVSARSSAEAMP